MTAWFGKLTLITALASLAPSIAIGPDSATAAKAIFCSLAVALLLAAMLKWLIVSLTVRPSGAGNPLPYLILALIEAACIWVSFSVEQYIPRRFWPWQEGRLAAEMPLYVIFIILAITPNWFVIRWQFVKARKNVGKISFLYGAGLAMVVLVIIEVLGAPLVDTFYGYFFRGG
ncbi:MAG: hypothetical protein ABFD92_08575 [Planctomycetaceae bacterium]|nr:hypothetical protein [Planctomycetaceae bacterium]